MGVTRALTLAWSIQRHDRHDPRHLVPGDVGRSMSHTVSTVSERKGGSMGWCRVPAANANALPAGKRKAVCIIRVEQASDPKRDFPEGLYGVLSLNTTQHRIRPELDEKRVKEIYRFGKGSKDYDAVHAYPKYTVALFLLWYLHKMMSWLVRIVWSVIWVAPGEVETI